MAKYLVQYSMKKGNATQSGSQTVVCDDEGTAIYMVEQQTQAKQPDYVFILKKVEKKS